MVTKTKPQNKKKMGTTVKGASTKKEPVSKNLSDYAKSIKKMTRDK